MKTSHARLIRTAIIKARRKTGALQELVDAGGEAIGFRMTNQEAYEMISFVYSKDFNRKLYEKAYKHTIHARGYELIGSNLVNHLHREWLNQN